MNDTLKKPLYEYFATDEPIDFRNYVFEKEKENYYEMQWRKDYLDIDLDTSRMEMPDAMVYRTAFYNNYYGNTDRLQLSEQHLPGIQRRSTVFQPGTECPVSR